MPWQRGNIDLENDISKTTSTDEEKGQLQRSVQLPVPNAFFFYSFPFFAEHNSKRVKLVNNFNNNNNQNSIK